MRMSHKIDEVRVAIEQSGFDLLFFPFAVHGLIDSGYRQRLNLLAGISFPGIDEQTDRRILL